ncbi:MAG: cupredoxin domain-containing protein [Actinomycetota bacterium]|jgi:hypothetical protein|nr:cupredoxin domain-containing protein [Actinomycetota bacterium]
MTEQAFSTGARTKYVLVGVIVVLAFFASYGFAASRNVPAATSDTVTYAAFPAAYGTDSELACGGECEASGGCGGEDESSGDCGGEGEASGGCGGGSGAVVEGMATSDGVSQSIAVDLSEGFFNPNVIYVEAGVPLSLQFGEGQGCMAEVMFSQFDILEDVTNGGALIELPALQAGEYGFSCGMEMVFGVLVAQ